MYFIGINILNDKKQYVNFIKINDLSLIYHNTFVEHHSKTLSGLELTNNPYIIFNYEDAKLVYDYVESRNDYFDANGIGKCKLFMSEIIEEKYLNVGKNSNNIRGDLTTKHIETHEKLLENRDLSNKE